MLFRIFALLSIVKKKLPRTDHGSLFLFSGGKHASKLGKILPRANIITVVIIRLNNVYCDYSNCKYETGDKSPLEELLINATRLILTIVGLRTAGDSTGKSLLTALLEENGNSNNNCAYKQNCKKYVLHLFFLSCTKIFQKFDMRY